MSSQNQNNNHSDTSASTQGHAVSMAKKDVKGSPTGAYTDIGAGRSSVVISKKENEQKTSEDAPSPREEQAP
jgi:hypothetical protein